MVQIYSASKSGIPIGRVEDYNNTNPSRAIRAFRETSYSPAMTASPQKYLNFASAIYGEGPYSLLRPNQTSDILAKNIDVMA